MADAAGVMTHMQNQCTPEVILAGCWLLVQLLGMEDRETQAPGALRMPNCFSLVPPFLCPVFGWVWLQVVGVISLHPLLFRVLRW